MKTETRNWQLFKHLDGTITKLYPNWHDMTEAEATTALSKFTQPAKGRIFAAPVTPPKPYQSQTPTDA